MCADKSASRKTQVLSDAQRLPFKSSSFDGVVSVNALYYCENPTLATKEFARVLRKNGKIAMVTPFIYPLHDAPHDRYRFTEHGLRELLKDDFIVERIVPLGGIFSIPLLLAYSLWKGSFSVAPKPLRPLMMIISTLILFIPLAILNLFSLLDVMDRSGRWPIYYFTVGRKK